MKVTTLERIENLRLQMQETADDKDLTDPRVVGVSEELDILINEFYLRQKKVDAFPKRYYSHNRNM